MFDRCIGSQNLSLTIGAGFPPQPKGWGLQPEDFDDNYSVYYPDIEKQVQENISLGDTDAVRRLLVEALEPTVDALMNNKPQLSVEEFEIMLDRLAEKFMEYVGPDVPPLSDYALSREGIYEDHL